MKALILAGLVLTVPATLNAQTAADARSKVAAARANPGTANVQRPQQRPNVSRPQNNANRPGVNANRPGTNVNRPNNNGNRPNLNGNRPNNNGNRPNYNGNRPGHGGNNTVIINNNHNNNYNWNRNRVRGPRYYYPHGYRYHRHGIGYVLPRVFLTATYYYTAYAALGLIAPDPGYAWVRYGPDLLLVDTRSGTVRDVRYGVFED